MSDIIRKSFTILLITLGIVFSLNAQQHKNADTKAELNGYCPVAYQVMNKSLKGDPDFSSTYENKTYYFLNADAKKMFDAEPEKYLPKYDGYCATAVAMGEKLESDPELFSVYEEATYLFSSEMAKETFDKDPEMIIRKADKNFAALNN